MSWREFVRETKGDDDQKDAAKRSGVNASTISRWLKDDDAGRSAENVIAFARGYKVSPLKALVEAGLLEPTEARMRPPASPDYSRLSNDELLKLVAARMTEEVTGNAVHPAANTERHLAAASGGATRGQAEEATRVAAEARAKQDAARDEMRRSPKKS